MTLIFALLEKQCLSDIEQVNRRLYDASSPAVCSHCMDVLEKMQTMVSSRKDISNTIAGAGRRMRGLWVQCEKARATRRYRDYIGRMQLFLEIVV